MHLRCGWTAVTIIEGDRVSVKPFCCRSWQCEACAEARKRQLRALALSGEPTSFLTLTSRYDPQGAPSIAAQDLVAAWRLIRRRLLEQGYAESIEFLAVFEETKKGWPHLHILMRAPYIEQKIISDWMGELTDSPIVDIRKVRSKKQIAWYISKYISKNPARYEGCKRYWRSQNYAPQWVTGSDRKKLQEYAVCLSSHSVDFVVNTFRAAGWETEKADDSETLFNRGRSPYCPMRELQPYFPGLDPPPVWRSLLIGTGEAIPYDDTESGSRP